MENKHLFLILLILLFSLSSNYALADMGPKPSVDVYVTHAGQEILNETFYAKMLYCNYKMKYEEVIKELAPYESSEDWFDRCDEAAPKYNLSKDVCFELQNQRGMTDILKESGCNENGYNERDPFCEKMIQKIPDYNKSCYWTIARMAWTNQCQNSSCHFNYYIPSEFILEAYLPSQDKIFFSAPVKRENFRSSFEANLHENGTIVVQETTKFSRTNAGLNIRDFIVALVLTLVLETLTALIFVTSAKISKKVLVYVAIANLISLPIVWFVFPRFVKLPFTIPLAEIFAFVFEAYFIYLLNKKLITLKKSFILSLIMNLASFFIGGAIFLFVYVVLRLFSAFI